MWKQLVRSAALAIFLGLTIRQFPLGELSWDAERLNLEMTMQNRVEEALSKILPAGQFVVVIRVEPLATADTGARQGDSDDGFYLPGVPTRKNFDGSTQQIENLITQIKPPAKFLRFIKRIAATLVIDQSVSEETVGKVREMTRQMLGLDPARGDTLDIQRTVFQKAPVQERVNEEGFSRLQTGLRNYWILISLSLILFCIAVFFLFVFGPLRGFLNRFIQVLPTLKPVEQGGNFSRLGGGDMKMFPSLMAQTYGLLPQGGGAGPSPANFSGSLQVENPNKTTMPFGFIREDHLGNLAILLSREAPEKAAVVLGYLPPEWISRVLSRLDPAMQSEVAASLATTRQLLPEQVEDIEQDLKRRLDYLIGGPERIFAVYESLDPEAQKRMLDSLKDSRPEIAEEMRHRTLAFEDLERLESNALKAVLREVDLQTLVLSLRALSQTFRDRLLEHVPPGKAEIIREELEFEGVAGKPTFEARRRIALIAKRLEREGQINIPQIEESVPTSRYGAPLRSTLKLPPGLVIKEPNASDLEDTQTSTAGDDIPEKIRRFMNRRSKDKERFPFGEDVPRAEASPPEETGTES